MDSREEQQFRPDRSNSAQEPASPEQQRAWHKAARGTYYSEQPVSKADLQSVDRVWGRLAEHVAMNSSAYRQQRNLQGAQIQETPPWEEQKYSKLRSRSRYFVLPKSLGTIAAVLVLTFIVGSMLLVFHAAPHSGRSTLTASGNQQDKPTIQPPKEGTLTIALVPAKMGGVAFQPVNVSAFIGEEIVLVNKTEIAQSLITDDNQSFTFDTQHIKQSLSFKTAGKHIISSQIDASIQATITVYDNRVAIVPSSADGIATFKSGVQKLPADMPLAWENDTDQGQAVTSDSPNCPGVKIPPHQTVTIFCKQPGPHTFLLQTNSRAQITVMLINPAQKGAAYSPTSKV